MIKKRGLFVFFVLAVVFFAFLVISTFSFAHKAVLITKDPSQIYFAIGKHYFNNNDYNSAIKYFKKSIELNPDFAEAYYNLGVSFYYNKDLQQAISFLKKSIEIKNDYAKAHYSIGLAYYELKDFDNAIVNLLTFTQLEPENPNAHFDLAVAYADRFRKKELSQNIASDDLNDLKEALKHYLKAEDLKPGFPHALSNAEIIKDIIDGYENIYKG